MAHGFCRNPVRDVCLPVPALAQREACCPVVFIMWGSFQEPERKSFSFLFSCTRRVGLTWMTALARFSFRGAGGRKRKGECGSSRPPAAGPPAFLLIRGTLLGGRVVQAHVFLAGPSADHPEARGPTAAARLPLLGGFGGLTRLGEVLRERKEKQTLSEQCAPFRAPPDRCRPGLLASGLPGELRLRPGHLHSAHGCPGGRTEDVTWGCGGAFNVGICSQEVWTSWNEMTLGKGHLRAWTPGFRPLSLQTRGPVTG